MEEIKAVGSILLTIFTQGSYDYLGWQVILGGSDTGRKIEKVYRWIKEILDFPVTIAVMIFWLHLMWFDILWFYLLKSAHSCDREYNRYDVIFRKVQPSAWGYWRWWVMYYGWRRTDWMGYVHIEKGYTFRDYVNGTGHWVGQPHPDWQYLIRSEWDACRGMVHVKEADSMSDVVYIAFFTFYLVKFIINNIII